METAPEGVSKIYWQNINPYIHPGSLDENLYFIRKLQEVNRHITIVDRIAYHSNELSSELLAEILYNAATIPVEESIRLQSHHVGQIFETLHNRKDLDIKKLTQLEWIYLAFLTDVYGDHKPQNLLNELLTNPEFFVEVISYVYRPDEDKKEENYTSEQLKARYQKAEGAKKLLDAFRNIPGVDNEKINKEKLMDWISAARLKAKVYNRVYGVDSEIGNLLACFPRNNVFWPPEEICEIIDTLNSDVIVSHFETEIFNSRGTYSKATYEGGTQERLLAEYFEKMGKQIFSRWPLTALALLNLAEGYKKAAKREDDNAQWDELR
jgi:hypothetical protein